MSKITMKAVNSELAKFGVEMVKGNGYFWFMGLTDDEDQVFASIIPSIYTTRLTDLSIKEIVQHVQDVWDHEANNVVLDEVEQTTIKEINRQLVQYSVKMVRGPGYFTFVGLTDKDRKWVKKIPQIDSTRFSDLSIEEIVYHVQDVWDWNVAVPVWGGSSENLNIENWSPWLTGENEMTYAEAKKLATRKNPGILYTGDAGEGWKFEMYWCPWRQRRVTRSINPEGMIIV